MAEKTTEKKQKPKRIPVKVIVRKGESALIEWGAPVVKRGYLPVEAIDMETMTVSAEDMEGVAPHGLPWEDLISIPAGFAQAIANDLRVNGIYTSADVDSNPQVVTTIFIKHLRLTVGDLRRKIKESEVTTNG